MAAMRVAGVLRHDVMADGAARDGAEHGIGGACNVRQWRDDGALEATLGLGGGRRARTKTAASEIPVRMRFIPSHWDIGR